MATAEWRQALERVNDLLYTRDTVMTNGSVSLLRVRNRSEKQPIIEVEEAAIQLALALRAQELKIFLESTDGNLAMSLLGRTGCSIKMYDSLGCRHPMDRVRGHSACLYLRGTGLTYVDEESRSVTPKEAMDLIMQGVEIPDPDNVVGYIRDCIEELVQEVNEGKWQVGNGRIFDANKIDGSLLND